VGDGWGCLRAAPSISHTLACELPVGSDKAERDLKSYPISSNFTGRNFIPHGEVAAPQKKYCPGLVQTRTRCDLCATRQSLWRSLAPSQSR